MSNKDDDIRLIIKKARILSLTDYAVYYNSNNDVCLLKLERDHLAIIKENKYNALCIEAPQFSNDIARGAVEVEVSDYYYTYFHDYDKEKIRHIIKKFVDVEKDGEMRKLAVPYCSEAKPSIREEKNTWKRFKYSYWRHPDLCVLCNTELWKDKGIAEKDFILKSNKRKFNQFKG